MNVNEPRNRMAVTKPRNNILIFRLTQDEYETLQAASVRRAKPVGVCAGKAA